MAERCGFSDGWLQCDLEPGHAGLHQDHWLGGKPTPPTDIDETGANHE